MLLAGLSGLDKDSPVIELKETEWMAEAVIEFDGTIRGSRFDDVEI
jgi:hypothetical protein